MVALSIKPYLSIGMVCNFIKNGLSSVRHGPDFNRARKYKNRRCFCFYSGIDEHSLPVIFLLCIFMAMVAMEKRCSGCYSMSLLFDKLRARYMIVQPEMFQTVGETKTAIRNDFLISLHLRKSRKRTNDVLNG